jgi:regulator of nonsense transcripts 2
MNLLADPCSVPFEKIERLAKIVGGLSDYHDWIGIFVVDDVIEYIRLALEINDPAMHQRLFSSVVYIGQLYNYTLCGNPVVFKVRNLV